MPTKEETGGCFRRHFCCCRLSLSFFPRPPSASAGCNRQTAPKPFQEKEGPLSLPLNRRRRRWISNFWSSTFWGAASTVGGVHCSLEKIGDTFLAPRDSEKREFQLVQMSRKKWSWESCAKGVRKVEWKSWSGVKEGVIGRETPWNDRGMERERERVLFAKVGRVGRRGAEGENQSGIKSNWHGKFPSRLSNARFLLLSLPPPFGDCYMFEELKATCSNSF